MRRWLCVGSGRGKGLYGIMESYKAPRNTMREKGRKGVNTYLLLLLFLLLRLLRPYSAHREDFN